MPLFTYKAIDARGKSVVGRVEAVNLFDLEQRLSRMGLDLVTGAPTAPEGAPHRRRPVARQDLINFCFHLEQLASAGVPLIEGLLDLRDSIENAALPRSRVAAWSSRSRAARACRRRSPSIPRCSARCS